jgi:ectoine hydroxylase
MSKVVYLDGQAGSVTIHNCRALHYSEPNNSQIAQPLLLNVYSNADAMPYTYKPIPSRYSGAIVWQASDLGGSRSPPLYTAARLVEDYGSIFSMQDRAKDGAAPPRM